MVLFLILKYQHTSGALGSAVPILGWRKFKRPRLPRLTLSRRMVQAPCQNKLLMFLQRTSFPTHLTDVGTLALSPANCTVHCWGTPCHRKPQRTKFLLDNGGGISFLFMIWKGTDQIFQLAAELPEQGKPAIAAFKILSGPPNMIHISPLPATVQVREGYNEPIREFLLHNLLPLYSVHIR